MRRSPSTTRVTTAEAIVTLSWAQAFIDVPEDAVDATTTFWSAVTGYPRTPASDRHPEFLSLTPTSGAAYLYLQRIGGPARVHLDFVTPDIDADTDRLAVLGATPIGVAQPWQTFTSPGGLPFCILEEEEPQAPPTPATWPGGHRSRVSQVCIDIPSRQHTEEIEFWTAATGWRLEAGTRSEFDLLAPPVPSGVQILLQRLDDDDDAQTVRAHVDIAADDVPAEVARIVTLGARVAAPPRQHGGDWVVLKDPAGLPFCVIQEPLDG